MANSNYTIRFMGDLGNLAQFTSGILGSATSIKSAFRTAATAPVTNLRAPNLSVGNLTTVVDSANKVLINSGQVFNRVVIGYERDLARLDAAKARSNAASLRTPRPLGAAAGPSAVNYANSQFNTPTGKAVYGTGTSAAGVPGVYAKDLKPIYENVPVGEYKAIQGDVDKINAAQMALIPKERELASIDRTATLGNMKIDAQRLGILENQTAQIKMQKIERAKLDALFLKGGGTPPVYNKAGAVVTPGVLQATTREVTGLMQTPIYQAVTTQQPGPLGGAFVATKPTSKELREIVKTDIANSAAGMGTTGNLQLAIAQNRGIDVISATLGRREAELKQIATELNLTKKQQQLWNAKIANQVIGVERKWAPETQARADALITPRIPQQLDQVLAKSKSFRNQLIKNLDITAPYGTSDFATQLDKKMTNFSVTEDAAKGLKRVNIEALNATGGVMKLDTAVDKHGHTIQKMTGGYRNAGSMLGMVGQDFKKVLEWTIATTVVFGAFGAAISTISKINSVNMDLQRFQVVAKTTGAETRAMLDSIADIAYRTATPLTELTSVMDDIALATRKAGQTSQEWATDMKALAESVGIFTNIAGVDTLKATELLSAAFKQLQIAPTALIGIMNKVSAVAGGNSQAMTDIVTALGTVAEAAKASMMSVDQQIAAVQVLSQVTNKSPADLATSFKNLFGAISSPASVKELKKFNIDVRDTQGNLKGFVPIYQEVYDAIQKGIIPAGQIQDVYRAIAGGPRRAPDAAAVLGNWPKIMATVATSANATNEALIANARIVDTNSAKLQRLKTAFETALVNQFSEAITKLVGDFTGLAESIGKVLSIFNFGGGNFLGSITTTIIKFAALAAGITVLTKGLSALKNGLAGISTQLGVLNVISKASPMLMGNATFVKTGLANGARPAPQAGSYISRVNLLPSERPGYIKYPYSGPYTGLNDPRAGQNVYEPVKQGYIGYVPNAPTPKGLNTGMSGIPVVGGIAGLLERNRGARLVGSGGAGAVAGLGLGAASLATGNGTFSSLGQTLGMMGMLSFQPELIAAGALTLAVSTLFQTWADGAEKAAAKQTQLENDTYDSIKTVQANQTAYNTLQTTQKDAMGIMDALKNKTNLTTDETSTLTAANEDYISSTLSMMDAEKALLDSRDKLLQQLPQLQKYQGLAKQAASLSPEDLKPLVAAIAQDILTVSGTLTPLGKTTWNEPYPQKATKPVWTPSPEAEAAKKGAGTWAYPSIPDQRTPVPWGGSPGYESIAVKPEDLMKRFTDSTDVMSFLNNPKGFTEGGGVTAVTPALTQMLGTLLGTATEDVKKSPEWQHAKGILEQLFALPGATTPWQTLQQDLAGLKAQTGAQITVGALTGPEAVNAQLRQSIADSMTYANRNAPEVTTQTAYKGSQLVQGQIGKIDIAKKIEDLVKKAGVGPNGESVLQTGEITAEQLRSYYTEITKLNPALVDGANNVGTFDEMTYRWAKSLGDSGAELDKLHHPLILLADDLTTLRESIEAARMAGLSDLADQWNTLQAQIQSGQFAGTADDATAQKTRIEAQMNLWNGASDAFNAYSSGLPMLAEELGKLQQFQKLSFLDKSNPEYLQQIIPIVMSSIGTYNLSAEAIDGVKKALVDLSLQESIIAKMPNMTLFNIMSASPEVLATLGAIYKKQQDIQALNNLIVSTPTDEAAKVINASRDAALTSLFNKRNDLQAQIQGGAFANTEEDPGAAARGQAQLDQTNALIADNYKLADSFIKNASVIPQVTAALSKLKAFENLKLLNMDDVNNYGTIIDALNGIAVQYGLTGKAADTYSQIVVNLVNIYAQIAAMPDIVKTITILTQQIEALPPVTSAATATESYNLNQQLGAAQASQPAATKKYNTLLAQSKAEIAKLQKLIANAAGSSFGAKPAKPAAAAKPEKPPAVNVGKIDVPEEWITANVDVGAYLKNAVDWAKKYQAAIPGEAKAHQTDLVAVMKGNTRVLLQKGIAEEYLNKAIGNLTDEIKKQNDLLKKADIVRRIRVGAGDFAALANVPINKTSGISVGSPQGPITISLNITGQVLTKAQTEQIGNSIAAALGSQITGG